MNRYKIAQDFYIDDHAVLFAYLVKNAETRASQAGFDAVVKGLVAYGRERGLRCAMRCLADGEPLTLENFMVYGEWADPKGWSASKPSIMEPNYHTQMTTCGWYDTWIKYDLLEYGRIYCDWVDENLVYGFNPELTLKMEGVMSRTGRACEFNWVSCHFADDAQIEAMARRRAEVLPRVTRDFLYHCGHLYATIRRTLCTELGLLKGVEITENAAIDYGNTLGIDHARAVEAEAHQDFLTV